MNINSDYEKINVYRGYTYVIYLNTLRGYRCGYIKLNENHKLYNIHFRDILTIESVQLTFSGKLKDLDGYYIGWDHNHSWDGVDEDAIRKHNPNNAEELIELVYATKDRCIGFAASLEDVEQECQQVIDELIKFYDLEV